MDEKQCLEVLALKATYDFLDHQEHPSDHEVKMKDALGTLLWLSSSQLSDQQIRRDEHREEDEMRIYEEVKKRIEEDKRAGRV